MKKLVFVSWTLFIKMVLCKNDKITFFDTSEGTTIGQCCSLGEKNGTCELISNCRAHFQKAPILRICGYENGVQIICCPKIDGVKMPKKLPQFDGMCTVSATNETGNFKLIKHCPRIESEVNAGAPFPRVCEYEVCRDVVCCPNDNKRRNLDVCNEYDNAEYNIRSRLVQQNQCVYNGQEGIYTRLIYCEALKSEENVTMACDADICEGWVCCPITDHKPIRRKTFDDFNFKYTKVVAGSCVDESSGQQGTCMPAERCNQNHKKLSINYTKCGYDFCTEFICCPNPNYATKSLQSCARYSAAVFETTKIIKNLKTEPYKNYPCYAVPPAGGKRAFPKEFPHLAALGYQVNNGPINWSCGGSLISERFVLTAAHCVVSKDFGPVQFVKLGSLNLVHEKNHGCTANFNVTERILHPNFRASSYYNDIALLKLDRNVCFNPHIRPACLPSSSELPKNCRLVAMGWGQTGALDPTTDWLVKVALTEFSHRECNESFKDISNRRLDSGIDGLTQLCAGSRTSNDDTCPGDSGGPLQLKSVTHHRMAEIVGITSFGKLCGFRNSPAVYTRVYPFIEWIESIVWT